MHQELEPDRPGKLYIVATPIGNLEDITLRALKVLKEVRLIAAEDTRHTKKLLNAYQITTRLTSLYEHNELKKSGVLIEEILAGADIAYVSDAGTPGLSDPGYLLVQEALAHDIPVVAIPGACAALTALCVSGLPMDSFVFHGFLPPKPGKRRNFLETLKDEAKTMIFYESPNRLMATLNDMLAVLGNRRMVVARELTKLYEETVRGKLAEIIDVWREKNVKGEITLILAGKEKAADAAPDERVLNLLDAYKTIPGLSERDRVARIAQELGLSKRIVYRLAMQAKGDNI
jgi:16S rRNA (cytidine1402-2'-O)-methyltransferase